SLVLRSSATTGISSLSLHDALPISQSAKRLPLGETSVNAERVERRLAAILAADVAGYSRLIGDDEDGTLARLKTLRRELIDPMVDRKSTRLNSSHVAISYAVFCLKK